MQSNQRCRCVSSSFLGEKKSLSNTCRTGVFWGSLPKVHPNLLVGLLILLSDAFSPILGFHLHLCQVELGTSNSWGSHATARILASDYSSFRASLNESWIVLDFFVFSSIYQLVVFVWETVHRRCFFFGGLFVFNMILVTPPVLQNLKSRQSFSYGSWSRVHRYRGWFHHLFCIFPSF